jgi:hypothetical protein
VYGYTRGYCDAPHNSRESQRGRRSEGVLNAVYADFSQCVQAKLCLLKLSKPQPAYRGAARAPKLDRNGPAHVCSSQGTKQCKINIKELHIVLSGQIIATLSSEDYLLLIARVL